MQDTQSYTGPERRHFKRRTTADRRQDIRFEPGKIDRRQIPRRETDADIWADHEE